MSVTAVLVPLADYLSQTTNPDCDYLEGRLVERNAGEIGHSDAQTAVAYFIRAERRQFWAGVEIRVQVSPDRFRVPDVAIMRGGRPAGRIITTPPEVAVEVLSPDDRAGDLLERIHDFLRFGVAAVWVLDPDRRAAWIHTAHGAQPVTNGLLQNSAGDLSVPLSAIFETAV
jgi:Uma2 family endonuclease